MKYPNQSNTCACRHVNHYKVRLSYFRSIQWKSKEGGWIDWRRSTWANNGGRTGCAATLMLVIINILNIVLYSWIRNPVKGWRHLASYDWVFLRTQFQVPLDWNVSLFDGQPLKTMHAEREVDRTKLCGCCNDVTMCNKVLVQRHSKNVTWTRPVMFYHTNLETRELSYRDKKAIATKMEELF